MKKFAVLEEGQEVNHYRIFDNYEDAVAKMETTESKHNLFIDEVWEFQIWFRSFDEKDFIPFYSQKKDIDEAIDEASKIIRGAFAVEMDEIGVVARYNQRVENEKLNDFKKLLQC